MRKIALIVGFGLVSTVSLAELEVLDNADLQKVEGQAGADISLSLSLNHTEDYQLDSSVCGASSGASANDVRNCRVGIALNNRFNDEGQKQWLVFKGIQGTIKIPRMGLDGTDVVYNDDSGVETVKPSLLLSFSKDDPIQIRNFGFDTLAIETDSTAVDDENNVPGYWALKSGGTTSTNYNNAFVDGRYTVDGYDKGREVGFTGIMMHGNLSMNNQLKIFSCNAGHQRC